MDVLEEDSAQVAKRQAIQAIMRDTSLTMPERQKKIQQFMASGVPGPAAAPAPAPASAPAPAPAAPQAPAAPASSRQEIMQAVMRDPSLTPQEKQQKIQQIMKSSAAPVSAAEPPPEPEPEPPAPAPVSASKQAMMDVMRDPSLSPQEKQQKIQEIMGGGSETTAPAPSEEEQPAANSSREAIQKIMKDASLTPQEKQKRVQEVMAGGVAAPSEPEPPAPKKVSSVVRDTKERVAQPASMPGAVAASSGGAVAASSGGDNEALNSFEQDALAKSRASRTVAPAVRPGSVEVGGDDSKNEAPAALSQAEQDALSKARARGGSGRRITQPLSTPPPEMAQFEQNAVAMSHGAAASTDENQHGKESGRSSTESSGAARVARQAGLTQVGAVHSRSALDPATRKGARSTTTPGVGRNVNEPATEPEREPEREPSSVPGASASTGVDPAIRKGARGSTRGSAEASARQNAAPGASASSGADPAIRKGSRASTRGAAEAAVVAATSSQRDEISADVAGSGALSGIAERSEIRGFENDVVEKARVFPTDNAAAMGQQNVDGHTAQAMEDRGPEISTEMNVPRHNAGEPQQRQLDVPRGSVDPMSIPVVSHQEAPLEDQAYAGLNYNPEDVAGAEEGGIQAFVADTAVDAAQVVAIMSEAEEEEIQNKKNTRCLLYGGIALCLIILVIVIPVAVVVSGNGTTNVVPIEPTVSPSSVPTQQPSAAPTSNKFSSLLATIQSIYNDDEMFSGIFENPESPQYRAALWASDEDSIQFGPSHPRTINRYVLASFYFSTNGDSWLRCGRGSTSCDESSEWLSGSDECLWFAISCVDQANDDRNITSIFFPPSPEPSGNNVAGPLPPDIGFLSELSQIILSKQRLNGTIPEIWSRLTKLQIVLLLTNEFTGLFPDFFITNNPNLQQFNAGSNLFTGPFPSSLQSASLTDLRMDSNQFTGALPPGLTGLTQLQILEIHNNSLTSTIPVEMYTMTNLRRLRLGDNPLTGMLPNEIGALTALTQLQLHTTGMGGPLPSGLFSLTELKELDLSNATFSGPLSESFAMLTSLSLITINDNDFSGAIPTAFDALTRLNELRIEGNELVGTISAALCSRKGVAFFDVQFISADCNTTKVSCPVDCCDACF